MKSRRIRARELAFAGVAAIVRRPLTSLALVAAFYALFCLYVAIIIWGEHAKIFSYLMPILRGDMKALDGEDGFEVASKLRDYFGSLIALSILTSVTLRIWSTKLVLRQPLGRWHGLAIGAVEIAVAVVQCVRTLTVLFIAVSPLVVLFALDEHGVLSIPAGDETLQYFLVVILPFLLFIVLSLAFYAYTSMLIPALIDRKDVSGMFRSLQVGGQNFWILLRSHILVLILLLLLSIFTYIFYYTLFRNSSDFVVIRGLGINVKAETIQALSSPQSLLAVAGAVVQAFFCQFLWTGPGAELWRLEASREEI